MTNSEITECGQLFSHTMCNCGASRITRQQQTQLLSRRQNIMAAAKKDPLTHVPASFSATGVSLQVQTATAEPPKSQPPPPPPPSTTTAPQRAASTRLQGQRAAARYARRVGPARSAFTQSGRVGIPNPKFVAHNNHTPANQKTVPWSTTQQSSSSSTRLQKLRVMQMRLRRQGRR